MFKDMKPREIFSILTGVLALAVFGFWYGTRAFTGPSATAGSGSGLITASGSYIGIGTTNPTTPLTVSGTVKSTSGGFIFPDGTTQTTAASAGIGGSGTAGYVTKFSAGTTLANSVILDDGINVGISMAPTYKLDVTGDVRWSGTLQGGTVPWARISGSPAYITDGNTLWDNSYGFITSAPYYGPSAWSCTVRSAYGTGGVYTTASCVGSEKAITGGCSEVAGGGLSSGQGWTCYHNSGGTTYVNCCS